MGECGKVIVGEIDGDKEKQLGKRVTGGERGTVIVGADTQNILISYF